MGNASGTNSSLDVITLDFLQGLAFTTTTGIFNTGISGSFGGPIAKGSSVQGSSFASGQVVGSFGPFSPPLNFSASTTGVSFSGLGNPLIWDQKRVFTFGAGSGVGAVITNEVLLPTSPSLLVSPVSLNLFASVGAAPAQQTLQISSTGSALNWSATVTTLNGSGWLSVSPSSGSASPGQPSALNVNLNYAALGSPGLYQGLVTVTQNGINYAVTIPVTLALSSGQGRLLMSQPAIVFSVAGGAAAPPPQTLKISNAGQGSLSWSIPASVLPSWLNVSPLAGTAGSSPSSVTLTLNNSAAQALAAGAYQVLLPVSAPGASNDPQLLPVTLQRVPASAPAVPALNTNGFVFVATQGGAPPPGQNLNVANFGGGGTLRFTATVEYVGSTQISWLSLAGLVFSGQIAVDLSGLGTGVYRAHLHMSFSSGQNQDADVVLVVVPSGTSVTTTAVSEPRPAATGCTPQGMAMVATSIGNGVIVPTSFPEVLTATVVDSCGNPVSGANVVAGVEGGEIDLQGIGNGQYSGTWVPQNQGTIPVTFTASNPSLPAAQQSMVVSAVASAANVQLPVLAPNGVVEGAGFTPLRPLSPGGIVSLFGSNLAPSIGVAGHVPLERQLAGVSVQIGNENAPLYYVSPGQINAQVPVSVQPGNSVSIVVNVGGQLTASQSYQIAAAQPGIFIAGTNAAVLDSHYQLITSSNPARIGDTIQIFATGLGNANPAVGTGEAGPPSSTVTTPVTVTIGGVSVPVVYQGLAPGFVGLYQVNVVPSSSVPTGDAVPIVIIQNGVPSNATLPATIPVH